MDKQKLTEGNRFSTAKRKWFNILTAIIVLAVGLSICVSAGAIGYKVNADAIKDVEKVVYENQLVPTVDALGNYSFTTDRDFKLMQLTDVHIGPRIFNYSKRWLGIKCRFNNGIGREARPSYFYWRYSISDWYSNGIL